MQIVLVRNFDKFVTFRPWYFLKVEIVVIYHKNCFEASYVSIIVEYIAEKVFQFSFYLQTYSYKCGIRFSAIVILRY